MGPRLPGSGVAVGPEVTVTVHRIDNLSTQQTAPSFQLSQKADNP
jgi:hypothetical protein